MNLLKTILRFGAVRQLCYGGGLIGLCLFFTACQNNPVKTDENVIKIRIETLLEKMTLDEKIGQTCQRGTSSRSKEISEELKNLIRSGGAGSLLNVQDPDIINELQRLAIEESPNGIPLIFARDVIHGFKTIFPIPLGQAATWNPEIVEKGARISAIEATSKGIRWTFAPMIDISRDPRWGRIAESAGEDPYLTSALSKAYVRGFQTDDLTDPTAMAACAKHFVGYGAAEGGRDYNSAYIPDGLLQNVYLKPFKAAVDQEVASFMTSFNELNGIPASGNKYLLKNILRDQWQYDGMVVSDWNSITEMIAHGYSPNAKEAALSAATAGVDMEMTSMAYENHMKALIEEGRITIEQLDDLVRNILRTKFRLGLFENPYFETDQDVLYKKEHLEAARESAIQSMVLLKNDEVLPIDKKTKNIAVIGPLADAPHEQLGTWTFDGEKEHTVTPLTSLKNELGNAVSYVPGLTHSRDKSSDQFAKALTAAKKSDIILFFGGEEAILSGEAHSRANIDLPGAQQQLIKLLAKTGKPIVLIIMAGRPITLGNIIKDVDAVLFAWHPGTMGGPAISDLVFGRKSPSGRLPVSWPKTVGQIPIYYNHKNTGRPASAAEFVGMDEIPIGAWQSSLGNDSHYLDDGFEPMFPFGYGLTYGKFDYSDLQISSDTFIEGDSIEVAVKLKNIGPMRATEVVQLYFQDRYASITRPVKELIRFKRIALGAGESSMVNFQFSTEELTFYNQTGKWVLEPGDFNLWVGPNSVEGLQSSFTIQ